MPNPSDVMCYRCNHSIDFHSHMGCHAYDGERLDKKCGCNLAAHHIANFYILKEKGDNNATSKATKEK